MNLTLDLIRRARPCSTGWEKLLAHLGKTKADDEPLDLLTVLDSNGLDDTLWVMDRTDCNPRLARHFAAWCAGQVLPIFERLRPGDLRPRLAIMMALLDTATEGQRKDAQREAERAAYGQAGDPAWYSARSAAHSSVRYAALSAGWAFEEDAEPGKKVEALASARAAQAAQFRKMLEDMKA